MRIALSLFRSTIDEEFYENELSPEDMLEISKRIKHSLLDSDEMTKMLIGQHPNTYTFTKALGEQLVKDQASELPVSIFRPSIVVASAQEPMPGWVDNLNGATGKQNLLTRVVFSTFFRQACQVACRNFELDQNFS